MKTWSHAGFFYAKFGWKKNIQCIRQAESSECGIACIAMIANYFGNGIDLSELRERQLTGKGANLADLISIASVLGFQSRPLRAELEELPKFRSPVIAHFDLNHFVVICKVGKRSLQIADPALGMRVVSWDFFSRHFTGVVLELAPTTSFVKMASPNGVSIRRLVFGPAGAKKALFSILAISLLLELIAIAMPLGTQLVVDQVIADNDLGLLKVVALSLSTLLTIQIFASAVRSWSMTALSLSLNVAWTGRIFLHLLKLPEAYFLKRHLGDVISRFGSLDTIQQSVANKSVGVVIDGLMAALSLFMLIHYSGILTSITSIALVFSLLFRVISYSTLREANVNQIALSARQQSIFLEAIRGITEIKLLNGLSIISSRFLNRVVETSNAAASLQSIYVVFGALDNMLFGVLKILILYLGARAALQGSFSAGMLIAFITYADQFSGRMTALFDFFMQTRVLKVHAERLSDILLSAQEKNLDVEYAQVIKEDVSIELVNVSFRYAENEPWILHNCSMRISSGELVSISGASGCGKSTLLKIVAGLLEPTLGTVRIGGIPLHLLGKTSAREIISVVMQESLLFTGTISDNIAFFGDDREQEQVEAAAVAAEIHDDIISFPMRYQTLVGDMGSALSGGQRQRLCLARALYRSPRVILLDEATSHVDIDCEKKIMEKLSVSLLTGIIVSHRPDTVGFAHRHYQLRDGQLHVLPSFAAKYPAASNLAERV